MVCYKDKALVMCGWRFFVGGLVSVVVSRDTSRL